MIVELNNEELIMLRFGLSCGARHLGKRGDESLSDWLDKQDLADKYLNLRDRLNAIWGDR